MRNGVEFSIGAFGPSGEEKIKDYTKQTGLVPKSMVLGTIAGIAQRERPFYFDKQGGSLLRAGNRVIHESLAHFYGLGESESPERFISDQLTRADRQVNSLVNDLCPSEYDALKLSPSVRFLRSPAAIVAAMNSDAYSEKEKHEINRQVALALISAEIDRRSIGVTEQLDRAQRVLRSTIFKSGERPSAVFALHDNDTNKTVWVESTDTIATRTGFDGEDYQDISNTHIKEHRYQVYEVPEFGNVYFDCREKDGAVIKALKKALDRESASEGENDAIRPIEDVPDIMGMKFVLEKAFYSNDPLVTSFMDHIKTIFKTSYGLTDADFISKPATRGSSDQSGKFDGQRLMVKLPGVKVPLEMMFHGIGSHFNNEFDVGHINPNTGRPDGAAHEIMEVDRNATVLERLVPANHYPGLSWGNIRRRHYERIVTEYKKADRVSPDDVSAEMVEVDNRRIVFLTNHVAHAMGLNNTQ